MRKRRASGMIIYALFVAVVLFILYSSMGKSTTDYNMAQFRKAVKNENVSSVSISQNQEVPTGVVTIKLSNGQQATLYVSDVNDFQDELEELDIAYTLSDIPHDSWISELLPMLIVLGAVFILFMIMMNAQGSAGLPPPPFPPPAGSSEPPPPPPQAARENTRHTAKSSRNHLLAFI